ncbi:MAG: sigma-70 family RNA polymerase sigma factor [Bacteroidota bacterium]
MFFIRSSKKRAKLSDQELIAAYRDTDDSTYVGVLYERYSVQIYAICKRYLKNEEETRDAAMEVFEYLLSELKKYEIQKFKSWLARATSNFCLMRIRKRKTAEAREDEFKKSEALLMESGSEPHPQGELPEKEIELQKLEAAIQELKAEQKTCVELFFLQGKSYDEVADLTGYSFKQVKSYIQNGKRNLKIRMQRQNE